MIKEILDAIRRREETVAAFGRNFIVRELDATATFRTEDAELAKKLEALGMAPDELLFWKALVRCVVEEGSGLAPFTDADIPELCRGSRFKLAPLTAAVNRVNGFDSDDNAKNSSAVQA